MVFDLTKRLLPFLLLASFSATTDGQETIPLARTILDLNEGQQIAFINKTIGLGFPDNRADQMTMLIINRSAVSLPLIESKVEEALKSTSIPKGFVDTATEMIAYAGNEQSLRAIAKLMVIDQKRFGPLVGRTLDNAENWRNPFTVVYKGLELGDEAVTHHVMAWAESALASNRMLRAWAEAILEKFGNVPDESTWSRDPIATRLKNGNSLELQQSVLRLAVEEERKRKRR